MQKKLIALAIASAMTVPALAYAEVNISGQANVSVDMVNNGAAANAQSGNFLRSNNSRVVLKGSDDLGNGLSAMYFLDHRLNIDDGSAGSTFWGGNAYVGIKSNDLGTVMLGRIDTPYKSSTRGLDVFFDVAGDNRGATSAAGVPSATNGIVTGLMSPHDQRLNNVIAYASPNMSGFAVSVASVFGGEATTANKKGSALSASGTYTMDNIMATVAYQTIKFGDANSGDLAAGGTLATFLGAVLDTEAKSLKVGGGYKMDAFTVNAVLEMPSETTAGVESKNTNFYLAGKFAVSGTDNVRAAYTLQGETKVGGATVADSKASQLAVGYEHGMSKATSVYATYVKTSADGANPDPSVLSFGMKHAF